ncbi:GFA family protein [Parasphingopyxis lamellibrachiae]|uniref:CENP-V/GFA domain-containing protein n=1 Tax=Parasphingopyxis lamellibrachiae TaxID=680125 RepID=A0A3D9FF24_9SPHN|nr:GFA family protein [Parasphingopyxis lamellibrachiae]RED16445.1 hypothetical protein DFR46_1468 [Parasphingopyxis lamellibrachiae]
MSEGFSGGCLCGDVRYESAADPVMTAHCQCVDCRKASGTGHGTHIVLPEPAYRQTGETTSYDHPADSGNIVSRHFCAHCGCAILSTNSAMPGMVFVRASSLDDPDIVSPQMVVYASRGATWDHIDPTLPRFDTIPEGGPEQVIADAM